MKRDPYNSKQNYERWIKSIEGKKAISGLSEINSQLLISFIKDFRIGINIPNKSVKGERSFIRLNHLRQKVIFVIKKIESFGVLDIRKVSAEYLHRLFSEMRSGIISTRFGTPYKSTGDYVKDFKTFWHWFQKVEKKKGNLIPDVTEDLDARGEKPKFVYFNKDDFENILNAASFDLKPILSLAFDCGARVTEIFNIKVSDFSPDFRELNIRDEICKTFGRRIKLMICPDQIKQYVARLTLKSDDFICRLNPPAINSELRKIGKKLLNTDQIKFKNLSLYDFRHSSACFWLPRYKSESAMKYRFGWKNSSMIHYYTEFLGMKDTIRDDDMYVDVTKTGLEKEITKLKSDLAKLTKAVFGILETAKIKGLVS